MKLKTSQIAEFEDNLVTNNQKHVELFALNVLEHAIYKNNSTPLEKQKMLELACGEGDHLQYFASSVDRVVGIDDNKEKLKIAKLNIKESKYKNIKLKHSRLSKLNLKKNEYNTVYSVNNLLNLAPMNHNFKNFGEQFQKSLKTDGLLIINISSHYQLKNCFWWSNFIPNGIETLLETSTTLQQILETLINYDFDITGVYEYAEEIQNSSHYYDPLSPCKTDLRQDDYLWKHVENNEYQNAINEIKQASDDNSIYEIISKYDTNIKKSGQTTFITALKY